MINRRSDGPSGSLSRLSFLNSPVVLTIVGAILGIAAYSTLIVDKGAGSSAASCDFDSGHTIVNIGGTPQRLDGAQPRDLTLKASKPLFKELPRERERYFFAPCSKNCHPMIRALRELGWQKVDQLELGRLVFTYKLELDYFPKLESWQRYNHIPNHEAWSDKTNLTAGWKRYAEDNKWPYFVPETYVLDIEKDREALSKRLSDGGKTEAWVMTKPSHDPEEPPTSVHLAAGSKELKQIMKANGDGNGYTKGFKMLGEKSGTMHRYVCDQFEFKNERVAIRSFWMIASMDPLIVLYQDGFARYGYKDSNVAKTTQDFLESTLPDFERKILLPYVKKNSRLKRAIKHPLNHIQNQMKESVAILVDAFRGHAFKRGDPLAAEDGFEYFAIDYILDDNLDVWMVNAYNETKLPEDNYFQLETNHNLFYGMGKVLTEIWDKQTRGLPILPLIDTDHQWQVVVAGGDWKYSYEGYERQPPRSSKCRLDSTLRSHELGGRGGHHHHHHGGEDSSKDNATDEEPPAEKVD